MMYNDYKEFEHFVKDFGVSSADLTRPWGGFFCIEPLSTNAFIKKYFVMSNDNIYTENLANVSPKILIINSNSKLSWQYHSRRKEIWSVLKGPVGVIRSKTDVQTPAIIYNTGDIIVIENKERHRLVGLDNQAVVAELWCHVDANHLSTEDDIIRLEDNYGR